MQGLYVVIPSLGFLVVGGGGGGGGGRSVFTEGNFNFFTFFSFFLAFTYSVSWMYVPLSNHNIIFLLFLHYLDYRKRNIKIFLKILFFFFAVFSIYYFPSVHINNFSKCTSTSDNMNSKDE